MKEEKTEKKAGFKMWIVDETPKDEQDLRDAESTYADYLKKPETFRNFKELESKWMNLESTAPLNENAPVSPRNHLQRAERGLYKGFTA